MKPAPRPRSRGGGRSARARQGAPGFAARLIRWQGRCGRHDLPWQGARDPYRIWLAEIMLQQTRVPTVIPYYRRFVERFPDLRSLAAADTDEVMRLWSGLGYYSRARNLLRAAAQIMARHGGEFPRRREQLERLPGVGRSTAAAIAAFAFGAHEAILDGNVKRVLARQFAVRGIPTEKSVEQKFWRLAESLLPPRSIGRYTQELMDLGAMVCARSNPACAACPVRGTCAAQQAGKVEAFPQRSKRAQRPSRETAMLLLLHDGAVLLEKRPPSGIWGGLWSLPEMNVDADPVAWSRERFGCEVTGVQALSSVKHGFTHFSLTIRPLLCRVRRVSPRAAQLQQQWLPLSRVERAALPAPVKRLLGAARRA